MSEEGVGIRGIGRPDPNAWAAIFTSASGKEVLKLGGLGIFFMQNDVEMMCFSPDGKVYVRGEEVATNTLAYKEFCKWFNSFNFPHTPL